MFLGMLGTILLSVVEVAGGFAILLFLSFLFRSWWRCFRYGLVAYCYFLKMLRDTDQDASDKSIHQLMQRSEAQMRFMIENGHFAVVPHTQDYSRPLPTRQRPQFRGILEDIERYDDGDQL